MVKASTTKQCLQFPVLNGADVLAVLNTLVTDDFQGLIASEAVLGRVSADKWRVYLPVQPKGWNTGEKALLAFRAAVKFAYKTAAGLDVGRESEQGFSVEMEGMVPPLEAAFLNAVVGGGIGVPPVDPLDRMIAVLGSEHDVAMVVKETATQGRDVRTAGAQRLEDGRVCGTLVLNDDPEMYGSVSAYLQRDDISAEVFSLTAHGMGFCHLWLEDGFSVRDEGAARVLSSIVDGVRRGGGFPEGLSDIACIIEGETSLRVWYYEAETTVDAPPISQTLSAHLDPIQPIDVTTIVVRPDAEASTALSNRIKELRSQVGYQVSIEPLRRGIAKGADVEGLLEQIDDLELQVAQIKALDAPQRRLMRFTDAQLPAMIEGLRLLPPEKLMDGSLQYAASHSAGRGEPAHYLSYDPAYTFMYVAEARWRSESDRHPIQYWLEPFIADAQLSMPSRTQVFVPNGHFMVPSLVHFGGSIDETLPQVLGNLFDSTQELISDKSRAAFYLFTPSPVEQFRLEVEVIDGDSFAPLSQQLEWINDYLQVRSPMVVDQEKLAEVAAGLYEGGVADALKSSMSEFLVSLDDQWSDARNATETEALGVINAVAEEMDAVSKRMGDLHKFLKQAGSEMADLEAVSRAAQASLKRLDGVMNDLVTKDKTITNARLDFESRMDAEIQLAEGLIKSTQERVETLQDRVNRIKTWGAT